MVFFDGTREVSVSTKADVKAERGTKRTCQNPECGSRFYDLNRDPITCPTCSTVYQIAVAPPPQSQARPPPRPVKKPAPFVPDEVKPDVPVEGEELVAVDDAEEVVVEPDADETFLEAEEESSDVSGIIDAPIDDADEKSN
jgi:uncharacterized protein (TIGR02300 family)